MHDRTPYPASSPRPAPAFLTGPAWRTALAAIGEQAALDIRKPAAVVELLTLAAECAEHDGNRALAESAWFRLLNLTRTHDKPGVRPASSGLSRLHHRRGRRQCATDVTSDLNGTGDPNPATQPGPNDHRWYCGAPKPSEANR